MHSIKILWQSWMLVSNKIAIFQILNLDQNLNVILQMLVKNLRKELRTWMFDNLKLSVKNHNNRYLVQMLFLIINKIDFSLEKKYLFLKSENKAIFKSTQMTFYQRLQISFRLKLFNIWFKVLACFCFVLEKKSFLNNWDF